jgi:uncharacterized protein YukJ
MYNYYKVVNCQSENDNFFIAANSYQDALTKALEELGYFVRMPQKDVDKPEEVEETF